VPLGRVRVGETDKQDSVPGPDALVRTAAFQNRPGPRGATLGPGLLKSSLRLYEAVET